MANSLVAKRKPLRGTTNNHLSIINNHFAYPNRRNNPKTHRPPNKPPIQPNLSTNYDLIIQNKANFGKAQMNVNKVLTKDYENKTLSGSGKNKANSKPNKANLLNAQMNVNKVLTKDYENKSNCALAENEPNSKPIQTQYKPNLSRRSLSPWAVEQFLYGLRDSLRFYELPKWWWKRVRTNNPLERLIRTLRDRLRPIGCFHDERAIERAVFGQLLQWQKIKLTHNT